VAVRKDQIFQFPVAFGGFWCGLVWFGVRGAPRGAFGFLRMKPSIVLLVKKITSLNLPPVFPMVTLARFLF
jgi:hypothetical protein